MKNVLSILASKFQNQISEFVISEAFVIDGELHTTSTYDFSTETYKNMVSFLNENGVECAF